MSTVTLQIEQQVAYLTINRAEKRNALTQNMWQQIYDYCLQLKITPNIKVLVLSASGDKAFSAGADIEELTDIILDSERLIENNEVVQQAQQKLEQLPFATIAAINGACVGGGLGLALSCDFRLAVEQAKFGITPAKLGLLYSVDDTRRLVNTVGNARAKELLFLGKIITTHQAAEWGLVSQICSSDSLATEVDTLVNQLLSLSGFSIKGIKQTLSYISGAISCNENDIRELFNQAFSQPDFQEGAQAFLQKRAPNFNKE